MPLLIIPRLPTRINAKTTSVAIADSLVELSRLTFLDSVTKVVGDNLDELDESDESND